MPDYQCTEVCSAGCSNSMETEVAIVMENPEHIGL